MFEVQIGLHDPVQIGTYGNRQDAERSIDQYNLLCNGGLGNGRVVVLEDVYDASAGTCVLDADVAGAWYAADVIVDRTYWPTVMHVDRNTREAFGVKNVEGDGRSQSSISWKFDCCSPNGISMHHTLALSFVPSSA